MFLAFSPLYFQVFRASLLSLFLILFQVDCLFPLHLFGLVSFYLVPSFVLYFSVFWASLVAQSLKHLPAMWETWVQALGWEDPLEKEMTTHSSILVWRIPWTEEPGGLSPQGRKELDTTERLHFYFLCLLIFLSNFLHLRFPFPRLQGCISSSFWFCPWRERLVEWFVITSR